MRKILIVEDEKDVSQLLDSRLKEKGFDTDLAYDGEEAIEKVKTFQPNVVILDIMLPKKDGLEVLKWIKGHTSGIYVIMATAKSEVNDLKKGYELKADYYVTKPYSLEDILKGITILLSLQEGYS